MGSLIEVPFSYVAEHGSFQIVLTRCISAKSSEGFPTFEGMDRQQVLSVA